MLNVIDYDKVAHYPRYERQIFLINFKTVHFCTVVYGTPVLPTGKERIP